MDTCAINILGSCISRDIFGLNPQYPFVVKKYTNGFSPFFATEKGSDIDIERYNSIDLKNVVSNFQKRAMLLDVTKGMFDFVTSELCDFIVVEATETRNDCVVLEDGNVCWTCETYRKLRKFLKSYDIMPEAKEIKKVTALTDSEIESRIVAYCAKIKGLYPLDKIILNETKFVYLYYDVRSKTIKNFKKNAIYKAKDQVVSKVFAIMKRELTGCHVINFPKNIICVSNHHLKLAPLHYTKLYYEYGIKAMEVIARRLPMEREKTMLEDLRSIYSRRSAWRFFPALYQSSVSFESN